MNQLIAASTTLCLLCIIVALLCDSVTRGLYSGASGFFKRDAQDIVVRTTRELAIKAGCKVAD